MSGTTIRASLEALKAAVKDAGTGEARGLLFLEAMAERGFDVVLVPIQPVAKAPDDQTTMPV